MFNFFKKKKPIARWYTLEPGLDDVWPVLPSNQVDRPWRTTPGLDGSPATTRRCPGINLITQAGWTIPVPGDFEVHTFGDGVDFEFRESVRFKNEKYEDEAVYLGFHDASQTTPILNNSENTLGVALKVHTPWRVEIDPDYFLLQLPVPYVNESRFSVAPGILDPSYSHEINIQIFWHVMEGKTLVRGGTPLVQYIPIHKDAFMSNQFNFSVGEATENDRRLERSFNYSLRSIFQNEDNLKSRLNRVRKVVNKYRCPRRT